MRSGVPLLGHSCIRRPDVTDAVNSSCQLPASSFQASHIVEKILLKRIARRRICSQVPALGWIAGPEYAAHHIRQPNATSVRSLFAILVRVRCRKPNSHANTYLTLRSKHRRRICERLCFPMRLAEPFPKTNSRMSTCGLVMVHLTG
jgi:hypothetical protein